MIPKLNRETFRTRLYFVNLTLSISVVKIKSNEFIERPVYIKGCTTLFHNLLVFQVLPKNVFYENNFKIFGRDNVLIFHLFLKNNDKDKIKILVIGKKLISNPSILGIALVS